MYKLVKEEIILPNEYLMYAGYIYIVDNRITRNQTNTFVGQYKKMFDAKEVRRCELMAHPGAKIGDMVYSSYFII